MQQQRGDNHFASSQKHGKDKVEQPGWGLQ